MRPPTRSGARCCWAACRASWRVQIALHGHQPFAAAVQVVYATLKALHEGTLPAKLTGIAPPELMKRELWEGVCEGWTKPLLSRKGKTLMSSVPERGRRWNRRSILTAATSLISGFSSVARAALLGAKSIACSNWTRDHAAIGLYFPTRATFYLQDPDGSEFIQELVFDEPSSRLVAVAGDWARRGFDSVGLYDPETSEFRLKYEAGPGPPDLVFRFGTPGIGAVPVAGRWTGKGKATVGVFEPRSGAFHLRTTNAPGQADIILPFGSADGRRIPIAGDWVGDGTTRVGLFYPATSQFDLRLSNNPANLAKRSFQYGGAGSGWLPVIGKWVAQSTSDDVGLHAINAFFLRYGLTGGKADRAVILAPQGRPGGQGPQAVAGRWKPSRCRPAGQNTSPDSPDWAKNLILYEIRIETFTEGAVASRFAAAAEKLPELQELGITGIVLDPIEDGRAAGDVRRANLFWPSMPDKINARLGSERDFAAFVGRAHGLGIRVIVNNVVHGLDPTSPYVGPGPMAFPPDWFSRLPDGRAVMTTWGTVQLDWTSPGLREWWIEKIGVGWVKQYDIDGFRMDLEPATAGTPLWNPFRAAVLSRTGKAIVLMPEIATLGRGYTYDMAQNNVRTRDFLEGRLNVVDFVKSAPETLYTSGLSNHDARGYFARGRPAAFAYGALLAPFIPYWFAGEEFNAAPDFLLGTDQSVLYFSQLHWLDKSVNRGFYDRVRKLIAIREAYKQIVAPLDRPLRQTNIAKVTRYSGTDLQPYVMWNGDTAIAVLASRDATRGTAMLAIPVDRMGMDQHWFSVVNLITDESMVHSRSEVLNGLAFSLSPGDVVPIRLGIASSPIRR